VEGGSAVKDVGPLFASGLKLYRLKGNRRAETPAVATTTASARRTIAPSQRHVCVVQLRRGHQRRGRRDAPTRMAHLLCEFALRLRSAGLGDVTGYELPMTQEQLADATGLTAVHVNRTLRALETEGLIERPNPRLVRIADWRKLAKAGDFDSNYLHMREDDPAFA
jgi:hypothetical protein